MRRLADPTFNKLGIKTVPWGLGRSGGGYFRKVLSTAPNNLIAYWPLWDASGVVAEDLINSPAQDGTYVSTLLGQPGIGDGRTSALLDGANSYIDVYSAAFNAVFNGQEGTCLWWARVSAVGNWIDGTNDVMIGIRVDNFNVLEFFKAAVANRLTYVYIAATINETIQQDGVAETDWMAFATTWSLSAGVDGEFKAYFQGAQTGATRTSLGAWAGNLDPVRTLLGAETQVPAVPWNGFMAHVAFWDIPLTAPEIQALATP